MGSGGSDGEDELPSSTASDKKLKFHKKTLEDSDAVDHASIPRKLRSVIRKRSCLSVSLSQPNSKRINHVNGSQTIRKEGLKKSKPKTLACNTMTKDEQEVAEALFTLAGTAPRKVTPVSNKLGGDLEKLEDSPLSSQGPSVQEEVAEVSCNPTSEDSQHNTKVDDLGKSTQLTHPKLSEPIIPNISSRSLTILANHQTLAKLNSGTKLNEFEQTEALPFQRISENTGDFGSHNKKNHASTQSKENGLYSRASHGSVRDHGLFPLQYSAAKLPFWLRPVASSSEPAPHQSQPVQKSEQKVETSNIKIKSRCATHVYISHFIQLSPNSGGKEIPPPTTHQFTPSEAVTLNVHDSFSGKNLLDVSRLTQLQEQSPLAHGNSTSKKQCYDFLSLSTGGGRTESKADQLAAPPVPKFQHLNQYNSPVSLPLPPNLLPSNLYQHHQLSASVASFAQSNSYHNHHSLPSSSSSKPQPSVSQVHLQFPPYFSSTSSMAKQQQVQPLPPQHHPMWMAQLAPTQIPHWQNPRQGPQQYSQAQMTPAQSSSAHFTKYLQMAEQHHQMLHFSPPFPPIRASSHQTPLPVSCDKAGS